jgi:hypothetical protein
MSSNDTLFSLMYFASTDGRLPEFAGWFVEENWVDFPLSKFWLFAISHRSLADLRL